MINPYQNIPMKPSEKIEKIFQSLMAEYRDRNVMGAQIQAIIKYLDEEKEYDKTKT
jgi:hypothetical protein